MDFAVHAWRFGFVAREPIDFPANRLANGLRGGFGASLRKVGCSCTTNQHGSSCLYAHFFEPKTDHVGPSGLADRPRPFVLRGTHLDGRRFEPGETFFFDVHVFIRENPPLQLVVSAMEELAATGFGPGRGSAALADYPTRLSPLLIPLEPPAESVHRIWLRFVTATELKAAGLPVATPEFAVVFGRARDRVATLSALYGSGPLPLDFLGLGRDAQAIQMTQSRVEHLNTRRISARTGQRHPLGGFIGEAEYTGELTRFVPILRAAEWTGVGRQTVWGKGQIQVGCPSNPVA